jgi:hypothetical protein
MSDQLQLPKSNAIRWAIDNPGEFQKLIDRVNQLSRLEVILIQNGKPTERIPVQFSGENAQITISI